MSDTQKKVLKNYGVRADEDKMNLAHELGVDIGDLFRQALDEELLRLKGSCPLCGLKTKSKTSAH